MVQWQGEQIAVEVDGPVHYLEAGFDHSATGGTLLKRRQLEALGWPVAVVPHWEWFPIKEDKAKRTEYLSGLLRAYEASHLRRTSPPSSKMQPLQANLIETPIDSISTLAAMLCGFIAGSGISLAFLRFHRGR
eukprot:gnl/TRDRNA2_/TRDRNA2_174217_c14_seq1.p1 gnl/TRDRNA2_/TRDRNA2_174217_c14~~gnl/TRDRNA2_/TRDRNA2_174217_c14_seq1.p1  ORF type:complete len:133 (-),score=21.18 gnl/TRDRNA2_/TRDRNA2_174217_c14_seq1:414-812(-)